MNNETNNMTTGTYLVACPALGERETVTSLDRAADVCFSMHDESGAYAWVEDWLGHTVMEYGGRPPWYNTHKTHSQHDQHLTHLPQRLAKRLDSQGQSSDWHIQGPLVQVTHRGVHLYYPPT